MYAGGRCARSVRLNNGNAFEALKDFYDKEKDWLFGHLGYDIWNTGQSLETMMKLIFLMVIFLVPKSFCALRKMTLAIEAPVSRSFGNFSISQ